MQDGLQEALRDLELLLPHGMGRAAGYFPTHECPGAGHHHRIDHAQRMHPAAQHPAVQVVLWCFRWPRFLPQHAVRPAGLWQAQAADALQVEGDQGRVAEGGELGLRASLGLPQAAEARRQECHQQQNAGRRQPQQMWSGQAAQVGLQR